jgi:hypothetical protein
MMLERGGRVDGSDPQFATGRPCIIGFNWKDSCEKYLLVRNLDQGKSTRYFWVTGQSITRFRTSARSRIDDHDCPPDKY